MKNFPYLIAIILFIAWAIGVLKYNAGGFIHILIILALVTILYHLIRRKELL
ncbi:lmo0937 family membrane protein [Marinigracilibium pacificum]|uniref:Lmo0937 family membrane protein n=1 Tax=Marinigracilibium pacificum TaxID=2729599 RepID=A0A848J9W3_9BACT|nr:lmo0937 family membrane protein [Marinigracilibium pacificum]NMM49832.1 lmo0937 family membrane protein [Marinigracilibium pacificum]